jgi:hypothetical protein
VPNLTPTADNVDTLSGLRNGQIPRSLVHLLNETNTPIYQPSLPIKRDILQPDDASDFTRHSSLSSIDVRMPATTIDGQISNDTALSDHSMEDNIPAESEFESSSGYDASSLMDVDVDSIHGSVVDVGDENTGSSKEEMLRCNWSEDDLPVPLSNGAVVEINTKP